ncbi:MAG TPA: YgjV family protein, partial [Candidatus Binatia bacterium]|nr:YgjV family protein [Candidatus Binatia bacterium]
MDWHLLLELTGYTASALIVISMMMSSIVRLRAVNLLGASVFAMYGLLIHAYPVALLNSFTMLVNAFYLLRMQRTK